MSCFYSSRNKVFPIHEINTSATSHSSSTGETVTGEGGGGGGTGEIYSDNNWHAVSVSVTKTYIEMHVDDHRYYR